MSLAVGDVLTLVNHSSASAVGLASKSLEAPNPTSMHPLSSKSSAEHGSTVELIELTE